MKCFKRSILILLFVSVFIGCGKVEKLEEKKNVLSDKADLAIYNSPYTYGEEAGDGTYDFYIYAAPVQWKWEGEYQRIENRLVSTEKEGYGFENEKNPIRVYFPSDMKSDFRMENNGEYFSMKILEIDGMGEMEEYENIYGEKKEAVVYPLKNGGKLYAYPVYSGIHFEYIYSNESSKDSTFTMEIEKQMLNFDKISDEYLQFSQNEEKIFLHQPFLKKVGEEMKRFPVWNLQEKEEDILKVAALNLQECKEDGACLEFSLLWDLEDMPDSTIYEKKNENVFSARSALVGEGEETGIGWHYLRYRFNFFYQIEPENILKAEYAVKNLNGNLNTGMLSLHEPLEQWSSTQLCWEDRVGYMPERQDQSVEQSADGWYIFDITNFAKRAVADTTGMTESLGSVLTCDKGYALLTTSDNGEFIPYIKLHLKNPPESFTEHVSINEVGQ